MELVNARVRGQIGEAQKDVRCVCVWTSLARPQSPVINGITYIKSCYWSGPVDLPTRYYYHNYNYYYYLFVVSTGPLQ